MLTKNNPFEEVYQHRASPSAGRLRIDRIQQLFFIHHSPHVVFFSERKNGTTRKKTPHGMTDQTHSNSEHSGEKPMLSGSGTTRRTNIVRTKKIQCKIT